MASSQTQDIVILDIEDDRSVVAEESTWSYIKHFLVSE